jgi:hypothetical protein
LVIETHSEVLVNRLGHLVADKKINAEDINIVLFEPSKDIVTFAMGESGTGDYQLVFCTEANSCLIG